MPEATHRVSSPWWAVSGVIAVYFSFGLAIGMMPPMVDEISADLDLSRSTMGSILGAWALIYVFTAVPGGTIVDRLGLRRAMLLGGASIIASMVLRAVATGAISLFLAVAIFGIGGPLVSISTPKLVATLFAEDERRWPMGLSVIGPSLGSAVGFALPNPVLLPLFDGSWRAVLWTGAAVALLASMFWLVVTRFSLHGEPPAEPMAPGTIPRLLRLPTMRWILAISLFSFAYSHGLNGWLPEILTDVGLDDNDAGYLAAAATVAGILGSLFISRVIPSRGRALALAGIYGVLGVSAIGLGTLDTLGVGFAAIVIGFARGGPIPVMFLTMMDDPDIDVRDMGAATGLFFAVGEIGGFAGPWGVGLIADRADGFVAATIALAIVAGCAALGAAGLMRRGRTRSPQGRRA